MSVVKGKEEDTGHTYYALVCLLSRCVYVQLDLGYCWLCVLTHKTVIVLEIMFWNCVCLGCTFVYHVSMVTGEHIT